MKIKTTLTILGTAVIMLASFSQANAQRCDKKKYCSDYYEDYDYRVQSVYAYLLPGDTSVVKTVIYSHKAYRIFACMDEDYGQIHFRIVEPYRVTEKKIKEIRYDTSYTYKTDEYGDIMLDDNGNEVVESMEVTADTIWDVRRVQKERLLYDSEKADKPYWEVRVKKTKRIFIYVYVPETVDPDGDCMAVYIGRKSIARTKFQRKASDYYVE